MNALVIGCGRVGSSIALQLDREGWEVTAVDEKEEALTRLGDHWSGGFVLGHGMDIEVLREAGIEEADAVVVATDGDNTNIVIGQVAQQRFDNQCVVVRLLDPARAEFYRQRGLRTVCPTSVAIEVLREAGIEEADAVVVSTDGDNTNIVIGQVAQQRFDNQCVVVRVLDPARSEFYRQRGLRTICPTSVAIDVLLDAVRACEVRPAEAARS